MGGFLNSFYGVVGPKIEELHSLEDDQRPQKAQIFWQALSDPSIDLPENSVKKQQAQEGLRALYKNTKEGKAKLDRAFQLHDMFAKRAAAQQGAAGPGQSNEFGDFPEAPQGAQPQPAQPPPAQAAPMSEARKSRLSQVLGAIGHAGKDYLHNLGDELGVGVQGKLNAARQNAANAEIAAGSMTPAPDADYRQKIATIRGAVQRGEISEDDGKKLMQEAVYASTIGKPPTASAKLTYRAGTQRPGIDPDTGKQYEGTWTVGLNAEGQPITWIKEGQKQSAQIRFEQGVVSGSYLKKQLANGANLTDVDGNPLKAEDIAPGMVARRVMMGGNARYALEDPHLTTTNFDNTVWLRNPNDPSAPMIPLGAQRLATQGQTEQVIWDPESGDFKTFAVRRETLPPPAQTQPKVPGQPAATPAAAPTPAPRPAAAGGAPAPAPQAKGNQIGGREVPGVPIGQSGAIRQAVVPVRLAARQLYGDRANPNLKPLSSYIDLVDKPESAKRIGLAVRIARNGMLEAESQGGHIGADVGPISVSTGGLGSWLSTSMGVPVKIAQAQQDQMQDLLRKMSPREREAFNALMSTFGVVTGLRSLTKQSAAQFAVAAIENEIPLVGYNTTTRADFADKMTRLGDEVKSAAELLPKKGKGLIDTDYIDQSIGKMKASAAEAEKPKPKAGAAAASPQLPDAARKQLKKGTITTFHNGQSWTLDDQGNPQQVH